MSEWCIHLWLDGKPCEFCGQPADEPCPSSCGVDIAAPGGDKTAYTYYFGGMQMGKSWAAQKFISEQPKAQAHAMSHPKAQEPAVSDAAWGSLCAYEPIYRLSNPEKLEKQFAAASLVLRTREEWNALRGELTVWRDKYDRVVDQLTDMHQGDTGAELATLRAQLADAQKREAYYESMASAWKALYDKDSVLINEALAENERLRKGTREAVEGAIAASKTPGTWESKAALLLTTNTDHRLGSGNVLKGKPEYQEPKPVIRTRPML
jgi:hypothetical protein